MKKSHFLGEKGWDLATPHYCDNITMWFWFKKNLGLGQTLPPPLSLGQNPKYFQKSVLRAPLNSLTNITHRGISPLDDLINVGIDPDNLIESQATPSGLPVFPSSWIPQ